MAKKPGKINNQIYPSIAVYPGEDVYPGDDLYPSNGTDIGGSLYWEGYTEPFTGSVYTAIQVDLFVKEHSIPSRKRSVTEINTPPMYDPVADRTRGVNAIFDGSPDLLAVNLSGHIKTPIVNGYYVPRDVEGMFNFGYVGYTFGDLVMLFLSGERNRSTGGALRRRDPDWFVDSYGHRYLNPIIQNWDYSPIPGMPKLQNFSCTILLES